jgi:hypothetical protein
VFGKLTGGTTREAAGHDVHGITASYPFMTGMWHNSRLQICARAYCRHCPVLLHLAKVSVSRQ